LITASPTTLRWIEAIMSEIKARCPSLQYDEHKYYATFKSLDTDRNIAYLNPQPGQIRLSLRLPTSSDGELRPAGRSSSRRMGCPSTFTIPSEIALRKATQLIILSYQYDREQFGHRKIQKIRLEEEAEEI